MTLSTAEIEVITRRVSCSLNCHRIFPFFICTQIELAQLPSTCDLFLCYAGNNDDNLSSPILSPTSFNLGSIRFSRSFPERFTLCCLPFIQLFQIHHVELFFSFNQQGVFGVHEALSICIPEAAVVKM
jgi:hypothetical protein